MLEIYNYNDWFENEETTNKMETVGLPDMPPLEGDEKEIKKVKGLNIWTPNKLLTRLPILLAQIKAVHNTCKLKNEMRQKLCHLYQHNKITKILNKNLINSL